MARTGPPFKSCNKMFKSFPTRYNSSTDSLAVVETQAQGYARRVKALWKRLEEDELIYSARISPRRPSNPSSHLSTAPLSLSSSGVYSQKPTAVHPVRHTYTSFPVQQYPPHSHLTRRPSNSEGNNNAIEADEKSAIKNRIRRASCSQRPSLPPPPPPPLPATTNATTTPSATDNTSTLLWSGPIRTPTNAWSARAQNTTTALQQQQQQQYTDFPEYEPPSWTWDRPSPSPPPSAPPSQAPAPVLSLRQQHRQRQVASAVFTEDDVGQVVGDHGHQGDTCDIEHNNNHRNNNCNDDDDDAEEYKDEDEDDKEEDRELKRHELEALEKELAILGLQRYQYSESHGNLQRQLHQQLLQEQQEQQHQEQQQYQQQYQRQQQYQEIQQQQQQQQRRQRELQNYKPQSRPKQNAVAMVVGGQEGCDDAAIMGVARKVSLRHERSLHAQRHRSMMTTFPGMSPTRSEFIPKVPTLAK
ncbi:hypothetical protein BG011_002435 [Mortierella polycephala]|uniref:Uncharacterized protein n=1 Tax=Mortierella polycephala TaxID=41804 RepID=A0A9P6Q4G4_9FUNG|nr:hypothetical protein BG011_002435 [Mortierella polycephala]